MVNWQVKLTVKIQTEKRRGEIVNRLIEIKPKRKMKKGMRKEVNRLIKVR